MTPARGLTTLAFFKQRSFDDASKEVDDTHRATAAGLEEWGRVYTQLLCRPRTQTTHGVRMRQRRQKAGAADTGAKTAAPTTPPPLTTGQVH
jgi:hypothetical protein